MHLSRRIGRSILSRIARGAREERGVALPAVLGIMLVVVVAAGAVVASSTASAGFASSSRASVQAAADANSGIEAVRLQMMLGALVCRMSDADAGYDAVVSYRDAAGTSLGCDTTLANPPHRVVGTPATATIVSTGFATARGAAGNDSQDRVKTAATVLLQSTVNTNPLTQSMFSDADLDLPNNSTLIESGNGAFDGDAYSNGEVTCGTQDQIHGTLYALGGLSSSNNCTTYGDVWVKGDVDFGSAQVLVKGSIYATGAVSLGTGTVGGNVIANGNVTLGQPASGVITCTNGRSDGAVCGSIYSLNGSINIQSQNGVKVFGSEYARGDVISGGGNSALVGKDIVSLTGKVKPNGGTVGGNITAGGSVDTTGTTVSGKVCQGASCPNRVLPLPVNANPPFAVSLPMFDPNGPADSLGSPSQVAAVVAPPRQGFPKLTDDLATWSNAQWVANDHGVYGIKCTDSGGTIATELKALESLYPSQKVLVRFLDCSNQIDISSISLPLTGDLAIMSSSGVNASSINVTSADGRAHQFMLITPAEAAGVTWAPAPAPAPTGQLQPSCTAPASQGMNLTNQVQVAKPVTLFVYTPCQLTMSGTTVTGQLYAGKMSFTGNGVTLIRGQTNVPGVSVPGQDAPSSAYAVSITSRFAVDG